MKETIPLLHQIFLESQGVCIDTRILLPNQLFFALKGVNFNGNKYAQQALANGARMIVVGEEEYSNSSSQVLVVENVLHTLQQLAKYHRLQFNIPFFAITGSNGKTSTKELIAKVMKTDRKVQYTQGNLNNHIGVPLTLLSIAQDTDFAIVEMGANHLGEIAALCELAQPTHGLVTNIGSAHIGEFGGIENIIRVKSELLEYLRKTGGIPFFNTQDQRLSNMQKRFVGVPTYPNKYCTLVDAAPFVYYKDHQGHTHTTEIIGKYNFLNIAAAITVGIFFGVKNPYVAVDHYIPNNNRSQLLHIATNTVILDAYNANPESIEVALHNLVTIDSKNKIAILGDMKELGQYTLAAHKHTIQYAETLGLNQIYVVGSNFTQATTGSGVLAFADITGLIKHLLSIPISEATVLVKGSRSMKMEQLTELKEIWH